ncbi:hypothetical protein D9757_009016 [Collybiopsis confluens]|uniref:Ubiquitin-like protease family profile domain-containing protein n=1 Tax=Collybiopsis confluens TaxID=2823264 RepID=A0A8H5M051_9AGAR|nr:hypothetical protein D9757_009016 [Collybiopsis confluens]
MYYSYKSHHEKALNSGEAWAPQATKALCPFLSIPGISGQSPHRGRYLPEETSLPASTRHCTLVTASDLPGRTSDSCIVEYLDQLSRFISDAPFGSLPLSMPMSCSVDGISDNPGFELTSMGECDGTYESIHKRLQVLSTLLSRTNALHSDLAFCIQQHSLSPNANITTVLSNLNCIHQLILQTRTTAETTLFATLDISPKQTKNILQSLMSFGRKVKLSCITPKDFATIGCGRWLNDEIINYFVEKWFLFHERLCIHARDVEEITVEDQEKIRRWCLRTKKTQDLSSWDRVFIPINENNAHWFSASINFSLKRIDVHDSLPEVYLGNRKKPIWERKNTDTMLILMRLAEILGSIRGEDVQLKDNPSTAWHFDPHAKVPFQSNNFDCGVHTLWHLQHVISFGFVHEDCEVLDARFTSNMVGKRVKLAQEVLDDCGLLN